MNFRRGGLMLGALLLLPAAVVGQVPPQPATPTTTVVRAVLFHSPSCPHCREVIATGLPPLRRRFGEQLLIAFVDVSTFGGNSLFNASLDQFGVPVQERGVPTMLVGARMLVGSVEIPAELPGLVERGVAGGGVDWPAVPALRQALSGLDRRPVAQRETPRAAEPDSERPARIAPTTAPSEEHPPVPSTGTAAARGTVAGDTAVKRPPGPPGPPSVISLDTAPTDVMVPVALEAPTAVPVLSTADRFFLDPIGNSVSVIVLLFMVAVLVLVTGAMRGRDVRLPNLPDWSVPVLALLGAGVAAYLAFVEITGTQAVCGPVGDCNTVQQSEYARLFGLPVGVLGVGGYLAMAVVWAAAARGDARMRDLAWLAIWMMALFATLFSVYLTFLEPFVIGATCAWCISSALIVTLILIVATSRVTPMLRPRGP
ncbi:MAG: vitamin K epoxide reductase family protein [Gemmatimonadaceae bacterium]|nr:vitamin K epoxide reductase family protein [Gemmatimonadaceae bacterium]